MELTDEMFAAANQRGAAQKADFPAAVAARYDQQRDRIIIALTSGLALELSPKQTPGLEHANPADLAPIDISPSGLGIHFPKLDADLYLPAVLEGPLGAPR